MMGMMFLVELRLVEQSETHVVVRLFLGLFFLLFSLFSSGSTTSSGTGSTSSGTRRTTNGELGEELSDVLARDSLSKELSPDGLNTSNTSSLGQSEKVVSGDFNLSIGKDEGSCEITKVISKS